MKSETVSECLSCQASTSSVESEKTLGVDADPSDFECPICCDLLLDPIVGKCGHDFCKHCLEEWIASQAGPATCPLCRTVLCQEGGERLGVCVRLKKWIERLFPEEIKQRRQEVGWPLGMGAASRYCHAYRAPSGAPEAQRMITGPLAVDGYSLDCLQCMITMLYP